MSNSNNFTIISTMDRVAAFAALLQRALQLYVERSYYQDEIKHQRAAKVKAYRLRKKWKAGDKIKVGLLGPSPVVRRRLASASGRGRPVVADYVPLVEHISSRFCMLTDIFDPAISASDRLKCLKKSRWCDLFIEAVYAGELAAAQTKNRPDAFRHVRDCTARAFTTNRDSVKSAVARARKERGDESWATMMVKDLEHWQHTGELPKSLQD